MRGRIGPSHAENRLWFERARQADPRNAYPIYALAYDRIAVADWAGAKELLKQAVELRPKDAAFAHLLAETRLALNEFAALEEEYRSQLKREPLNYFAASQLCNVLLAQAKVSEAQQVLSAFERAASAEYKQNARQVIDLLQCHWLYASGDFARYQRKCIGESIVTAEALQQYKDEDIQPDDRVIYDRRNCSVGIIVSKAEDPFHLLIIAVAFEAGGKATDAAEWRTRAIKGLADGNSDYVRSAELLQRGTEPAATELDDLILPANLKAIVLTALAQKHSARRAELGAAARRFNVERYYPYHLIQRVTAQPVESGPEN